MQLTVNYLKDSKNPCQRMKRVHHLRHVLHPVMQSMRLLNSFLHSLAEVQTLQAQTKRQLKVQAISLPSDYSGRNIWFGVREFAMGTALNGMALHGGLHVFGGTFFVFSDYVRPAIRLIITHGCTSHICIHT